VASGTTDEPVVDVEASDALRGRLRQERPEREPFFDRGPGYARLAGGRTAADVDWV
jgi:N-methylhydantoinase B